MIQDRIATALKDLNKIKLELRELKKTLKNQEKIDSEEYTDLKKAYRDLKEQMKTFEDKWKNELLDDNDYVTVREMKEKKEEEIAQKNAEIFNLISELPQQPAQMNVETEDGQLIVRIQPEMKLYLNGKEERKRA